MNTFETVLSHNRDSYLFREVPTARKREFNGYVHHSNPCSPFQCFEWGEVKRLNGWEPLRLTLEKNGAICGVATILIKKTAGLTFFYSPRGPLLDYRNPIILPLFCQGVGELARVQKAVFWRIDPELMSSEPQEVLAQAGLRPAPMTTPFGGVQPRWVWRIPLQGSTEAQWSLITKGCRRQIKKAKQAGVEVRTADRAHLPLFFELLQSTAANKGIELRDLSYFENLWDHLAPTGSTKMVIAFMGKTPVSTALALKAGKGIWDIYAGNTQASLESGASYLLTWELIDWANRLGYSFYDLGGIQPGAKKGDPSAGLEFFKSRFGGEQVEFVGEWDLIFNPHAYRLCQWGQKAHSLLGGLRKHLR